MPRTKRFTGPVNERIRQARLRAGLTQAQLAAECGVPQPNLSAMESGKRRPSIEQLQGIAAALGVNAGSLLD